MTVKIQGILKSEEFTRLNKESMANGMYNTDRRVFTPGMAWEMNWYFDPTGEREKNNQHVMFKLQDREAILSGKQPNYFLSMHYWKDWSHLRPPINIICPNGEEWCFDRLSKDGDGWTVSGEFPMITCSPFIVVSGYHGHLVRGMFSADIEGRGPNGISRS